MPGETHGAARLRSGFLPGRSPRDAGPDNGGMETKRPYYRTKAEWAAAEAHARRQQARLLPIEPAANWRRVRGRMRAVASLQDQARKFDRLAERFRARGE
jgi:hypothetical protein